MGHAVTPGVFQKASVILLSHVQAATGCNFLAYLDDWLLYHTSYPVICKAFSLNRKLGVTINDAKSSFRPVTSLSYLGFFVNSADCSLTLEAPTLKRLKQLIAFVRPGFVEDRERIHGFATWVMYNIS